MGILGRQIRRVAVIGAVTANIADACTFALVPASVIAAAEINPIGRPLAGIVGALAAVVIVKLVAGGLLTCSCRYIGSPAYTRFIAVAALVVGLAGTYCNVAFGLAA